MQEKISDDIKFLTILSKFPIIFDNGFIIVYPNDYNDIKRIIDG